MAGIVNTPSLSSSGFSDGTKWAFERMSTKGDASTKLYTKRYNGSGAIVGMACAGGDTRTNLVSHIKFTTKKGYIQFGIDEGGYSHIDSLSITNIGEFIRYSLPVGDYELQMKYVSKYNKPSSIDYNPFLYNQIIPFSNSMPVLYPTNRSPIFVFEDFLDIEIKIHDRNTDYSAATLFLILCYTPK